MLSRIEVFDLLVTPRGRLMVHADSHDKSLVPLLVNLLTERILCLRLYTQLPQTTSIDSRYCCDFLIPLVLNKPCPSRTLIPR